MIITPCIPISAGTAGGPNNGSSPRILSYPPLSASGVPVPDFSGALISAPDLLAMDLPPRPLLLGKWMKQGDLGYLFAPRGAGKSWMAMYLGNAVAEGAGLGEWAQGELRQEVYYLDAEMNLADVQERALKMGIQSSRFIFMSNEMQFLAGR